MTKTQPSAKKKQVATEANLEALTQRQAAWLVGKPAVWFRDNPHCCGMNSDGKTYNARELMRAVATEYELAELGDADIEYVFAITEDFATGDAVVSTMRAVIRILEGVVRKHGIPGLATVGQMTLDACRDYLDKHPNEAWQKPTPEEIQAEADGRIADLPSWGAHAERREVLQCFRCNRYRWGGEWLAKPIPANHVTRRDVCPDCEKKHGIAGL